MGLSEQMKRRLAGLVFLLVGGLLLLAMALTGRTGFMGRGVGAPLREWLGFTGFIIPLTFLLASWWVLRGEAPADLSLHVAGLVLLFICAEIILGALPLVPPNPWSGSFGSFLSEKVQAFGGLPGALLIAVICGVAGLWLTRNDRVLEATASIPGRAVAWFRSASGWFSGKWRAFLEKRVMEPPVEPAKVWWPRGAPESPAEPAPLPPAQPEVGGSPAVAESAEQAAPEEGQVQEEPPARAPRARRRAAKWSLPPAGLLDSSVSRPDEAAVQGIVRAHTTAIEKSLAAFRIEGRIVGATIGPRVILYEWQQGPGVRASRIEQLQDDLALALKAERVRVVVPLPGKGTIGIEVPNPLASTVTFGSVISAFPDPRGTGALPIFLGRLLTGEPLFADLGDMPHMLIAGTTGSGKSVCIHDVIASMLMTRTPDELRLILIDPKMVELRCYNRAPHLLFPVITDAKRAVAALRWATGVMEARYRLLAHYGARDLPSFNRMLATAEITLEGNEEPLTVLGAQGLPWVVIAVDELADLMAERPREVETLLQRLAQMSRGVGIHLVVATQRPSVDVITGVIKANMPSRLAFQVSSAVDSRTIIDSAGAEQLLGRGDMLYLPIGAPDPVRAQGSLVTMDEVKRLVEHWAAQGAAMPVAGEGAAVGLPADPLAAGESEEDPLLRDAIRLVLRTGEASISMLQRHLSTGFSRAGRLIDMMERRGVIGPKQGSRPREIIVDREEYQRRMDEEEKGK